MSIETNIPFPNVNGVYVKISGLEVYPRSANFQNETILLDNITIEEDMFAESVFGSVEFIDSSPNLQLAHQINLYDGIIIGIDGDTFNFVIIDINVVTDLASKKLIGPESHPTKIIVRFASSTFVNENYQFDLQDVDFIGKISRNPDEDGKYEPSYVEGVDLPLANNVTLPGFVQTQIAPRLEKELKADSTFNDIWLKPDPIHYPFSKLSNSMRLSQLMNYVCEYACDAFNPEAVNFFFWEDLYSWNFRSIESIINKDYNNIKDNKLPYYTPSLDENNLGAIVSFEVINPVIPIKLKNAGAFGAEYIRIKPNWESPYFSFVGSKDSLIKQEIVVFGNYATRISSAPVYEYTVNTHTTRISDANYGFYTDPYNQPETPWWNYYDDYNAYKSYGTDKSGDTSRTESQYWQSQFDFCELPGDYLQIIYKNIKNSDSLKTNKKYYSYLKTEKTKWDVYKNNICCVRDKPETFFAILTRAEKIYGSNGYLNTSDFNNSKIQKDSGGIYAYEWVEVEFWPRNDIKQIPAPNSENQQFSDYSVIEFEDNSFPFVFVKPIGYMEGLASAGSEFSDNRAYNLNEILNSRIPIELEASATGPFTLMMNPGISDALGFTGEAADRKSKSSYPGTFSMMPVGKFKTVSTSPTEYQGGRVVQMYRIPKAALSTLIPKDDAQKDVYIFDVENAHDGLCS